MALQNLFVFHLPEGQSGWFQLRASNEGLSSFHFSKG